MASDNYIQKSACGCSHCNTHSHTEQENQGKAAKLRAYLPGFVSFVLLISGLIFDHFLSRSFFSGYIRLAWYTVAFLIVAFPVLKEVWGSILKKHFFNEFTLMSVATIGAFCIGEYPEGVAVMLFYAIGELFQASAVNKAERSIKALIDIRPDKAFVKRNGRYKSVSPQEVRIGETIQIKAGEKVPLDSKMLSPESTFDTRALTGESRPSQIKSGENVLAGMVNLEKVIELKVAKKYTDSSLARILDMVQNATSRKAKTELLITRFARIYTPLVFFLALAITLIPALFVSDYVFSDWLYRGLVFLVISCPCALVISVPLGYFGGIGAASRHGILFKGANFIDTLCDVNTVVFDKTGTLTKGVFEVQKIEGLNFESSQVLAYAKALEQYSNHPVAKAVMNFGDDGYKSFHVENVEEIAGHGLKGTVDGKDVAVGNNKLLKSLQIDYDEAVDAIAETTILVAVDNRYAGYILVADEIKEDAPLAIAKLKEYGILRTVVLSGDKSEITKSVASQLHINVAYGDLLPENKMSEMVKIKSNKANIVAFVGDGINDTPVLALSDVGIAMGGMGADAAIETADVVIQTDHPSKIATAIQISKATKNIVKQNIGLAFGIKLFVMILGGIGVANMWEAVFADVGVALLAILNAMRILNKKFR
ncbi:MAG: ziaA [Bacteroidetes bacterium]|nr:ziaA [Bacteroidota bacterium]